MSEEDASFMQCEQMKWGIILLAVILILGTMFDLYFSLAVRTYYLTKLYYPDLEDEINEKEAAMAKAAAA